MEKGRIKKVSIHKLWGVKNIEVDFDNNVNIFIGANGTSKTTFLNLIEATLLCDLQTLYNIEFSKIEIELNTDYNLTTIIVKKLNDIQSYRQCFEYNIIGEMDEMYEIFYEGDYRFFIRRGSNSYGEYKIVKDKLSKLLNISWLSINRDDSFDYEYYRRREYDDRLINSVDKKIEELAKELIGYKLQLEAEVSKSVDLFKKESLLLMLYDSSEDNLEALQKKSYSQEQINDLRVDLYKVFRALGIKSSNAKIQQHIAKINEIIDKKEIIQDEALVLPLIRRAFSMLDIFNKYEEEKDEILMPLNNFWKCLKEFMVDKEFSIDTENGEIKIELKEGDINNKFIDVKSLSSGEKQLFILLAETLLQKKSTHLFIADEPELSLHIGWQRIILKKILELNPNAQIVVATHSPEIASEFPENIINMKRITSYE
jgi:predicted ATPase